ncbi:MAG: molybdopterin converting factor [Lysobacter sp.]|nr:MAG: molybdopterin converting factor [Lysobacter sp.]
MTVIELQLFGAFRDAAPSPCINVVVDGGDIAALRAAVQSHAQAHWPPGLRALVARSAFANESTLLRDADLLPDDARVALLPPVSGG